MYRYSNNSTGIGGAFLGFVGGMVIWALFGDKIKQKVNENRTYQEMRGKVMDRLADVRNMTETQYHQIVDEVSSSYARAKGISQNELKDLVADLKLHWMRIKDRWNEPTDRGSGTNMISGNSNFDDGFNTNA